MATRKGKPNKNDTLTGTTGSDTFYGYSGNDVFIGRGGNDTMFGGAGHDKMPWNSGNDHLDGGSGPDSASWAAAPHAMVVDLAAGTASQIGGGEEDTLVSIESVNGSNFGDSLYGSDRSDEIEYFIPDYTDVAQGATGFPNLTGGADFVDGRGGVDMLSFWNEAGGVMLDIAGGIATDGNGNTDTFLNIEQYEGSMHDDTISGGSLADTIFGMDDADSINGGAGRDTISGDDGKDTIAGDGSNDSLLGGSGKDSLDGGAGRDTLAGGTGRDFYTGGSGKDLFRFQSLNEITDNTGRDVIVDFTPGVDKIDLSAIDANSSTATDNKFRLYAVGEHDYETFDGYKGRLIWYHNDARTYSLVKGDVDGDKKADFTLELRGDFYIASTDFIL
jgi:Ca2+-binding RTX toxin-like protein